MRANNMKLEAFVVRFAFGFASGIGFLILVCFAVLVSGLAGSSFAQNSQPKTFSSPGAAARALFEAAQKQDEPSLEEILGAGKEVTSSSDEEEDKLERDQFAKKYQEMHRLVREPDGNTVLYLGAENWPFPIPLVARNGAWYFDSETGSREIVFRRIGENEATAITVCEEFAIATQEQGVKPASYDPITQFAQNLVSASITGSNDSELFHGYYFRPVTVVSRSATSRYPAVGTKSGVMLVAYPAEYRSSGVKTFVVKQNDIVFEKDLGPNTKAAASNIKFNLADWQPAE
jgi:hypothetical protein